MQFRFFLFENMWRGARKTSHRNSYAFSSCGANSIDYIQCPAGTELPGQSVPVGSFHHSGEHRYGIDKKTKHQKFTECKLLVLFISDIELQNCEIISYMNCIN